MADQTCNPSVITQALGIQATGPRTVIVPADPIIWDDETSYEYLTIVASNDFGQAYISKKDVPAGTELTNTDYWIPAATFNAQLAAIQKQLTKITSETTSAIAARQFYIEDYKTDTNTYSDAFTAMLADVTDGGTLNVPGNVSIEGSVIINKPNVVLTGGGTLKSLTIDVDPMTDEQYSGDAVKIDSMRFVNTEGEAITIKQVYGLSITNCDITAGIGINANGTCSMNQQLKQVRVENNTIRGNIGIYVAPSVNANDYYYAADWIINGNTINSNQRNIYFDYFDGVAISSNIMFMSLGEISEKLDSIYLGHGSFTSVTSNHVYEPGLCGIRITGFNQSVLIEGNLLVWCGQKSQSAAIHLETSNSESDYCLVSNNKIDHPTGDGIYTTYFRGVYNGNAIEFAGSSDHYFGSGELSTAYMINAPESVNGTFIGNWGIGNATENIAESSTAKILDVYGTDAVNNNVSQHAATQNLTTNNQPINWSANALPQFLFCTVALSYDSVSTFINGVPNGSAITGYVVCYGGTSLTINETKVVDSGQIRPFVIYNNDLTFYSKGVPIATLINS